MAQLTGKTAIITGATSGIGREAAKVFAAEGAKVVVSGRRAQALETLVEEIKRTGGAAAAVVGDVRQEDVARKLVEVAVEQFGGLDIAFNNAGSSGAMGTVADLTADDWNETLASNLTSAFFAAKYQVPAMIARGRGSLIFTSSFVGHGVGFPGLAAYAAAKAGLIGLVQVLATELGPKGIRANALLPGGTDTPSNHANAPGAGPEVRQFVESLHALKRLARPEEIARAALFLASDASSFVTGSAFLADGGVSINRT